MTTPQQTDEDREYWLEEERRMAREEAYLQKQS